MIRISGAGGKQSSLTKVRHAAFRWAASIVKSSALEDEHRSPPAYQNTVGGATSTTPMGIFRGGVLVSSVAVHPVV